MSNGALNNAAAQTRFVNGWLNGIITACAVIEHNGREYRTDQMEPSFNRAVRDKLSSADKFKVFNTCKHMQNHIRDHFGAEGQAEINRFKTAKPAGQSWWKP